ncbi:hypothetical protein SLOPH_841 [Spraguea lophii 42_110]|uniref:Protein kinase domain-containing protein n=1 Tax=Spraguea lophii (strain 42_110) TaxID=1358809 RepID=S7WBX0_SPRLO|nr:hypothetical protein SLOPH_841 [Spraguea lophii 42_110]
MLLIYPMKTSTKIFLFLLIPGIIILSYVSVIFYAKKDIKEVDPIFKDRAFKYSTSINLDKNNNKIIKDSIYKDQDASHVSCFPDLYSLYITLIKPKLKFLFKDDNIEYSQYQCKICNKKFLIKYSKEPIPNETFFFDYFITNPCKYTLDRIIYYEEGNVYIYELPEHSVMELQFTEIELKFVIKHLILAIEEFHRRTIIHKNISIKNIFSSNNEIQIEDFSKAIKIGHLSLFLNIHKDWKDLTKVLTHFIRHQKSFENDKRHKNELKNLISFIENYKIYFTWKEDKYFIEKLKKQDYFILK